MELFVQPIQFEKRSTAETTLAEDPNQWPQEVLQELYKQVPFISDFAPNVKMDKVDAERGYGFGHVLVMNDSEVQAGAPKDQLQAGGIRQVRIPIVVKENKLQPFDLIITDDAKVMPLTESRLRQAIFRPQQFDVTSQTPGDQSMIGQLYPPYRQNYGFGGGGVALNAGMGKSGSVKEGGAIINAGLRKYKNRKKNQSTYVKTAAELEPMNPLEQFLTEGVDWNLGKQGSSLGDLFDSDFETRAGKQTAEATIKTAHTKKKTEGEKKSKLPKRLGMAGGLIGGVGGMQAGSAIAKKMGRGPAGKIIGQVLGGLTGMEAGGRLGQSGGKAIDRALSKVDEKAEGKDKFRTAGLSESEAKRLKTHLKEKEGEITKRASVLEAILPTINVSDYQKFANTLEAREVQAAFAQNAHATSDSLQTLLGYTPRSFHKTASLFASLSPSVLQICKAEEGYTVKTANHTYWQPLTEALNRGELVERFGEKVALAVDTQEQVTLSEEPDGPDTPDSDSLDPSSSLGEAGMQGPEQGVEGEPDSDMQDAGPITENGLYKVQTTDGDELIGYVFVDLMDVDGMELPLALFTNGSQSAVQTDIIGRLAGDAHDLPTADEPCGYGSFVSPEGKSTVPIEIKSSTGMPGEPSNFQGETFDGRPIQVSVQPNIQTIIMQDDTMMVPEHWRWMTMASSGGVALASAEEEESKEGAALRSLAVVELRCGGSDTFSIRGPLIDKLAFDEREMISLDDTMFLLAGLGVPQAETVEKIGHAFNGHNIQTIRVRRQIKTASEQKFAASRRAEALLSRMPDLRQDLVKEAAVISDPSAVDTVLSLGFINPENLMTFISYLPVIEEAQKKMSELLLASRLGLSDVPASALESAIRSTEETLEGLKIMAFENQ